MKGHTVYHRIGRRFRDLMRRHAHGTESDQAESPTARSINDLFKQLTSEAIERGANDDIISAALDEATQAAADVLAKRLQADAPRMLREHREIREGFERRLQQRWGRALGLYKCILTCCLEAGEEFHKQHLSRSEHDGDAKFESLTLLHVRACLVGSEILALLRTGHAAGAQARWRTIHELAVIAFVLGNQDSDISERFLSHRYVEQSKNAQTYQRYCQALGYDQFSDEEMEGFLRGRNEVVSRYGAGYQKDWGWAKPLFPGNQTPNFVTLEEFAGLDHFRPWFQLSSHGIHSGSTGAAHTRDFYGRGQVMLAGPSNAGLADPGNGALVSLYQVTTVFLLHGSPQSPEADDLITLKAIAGLLDQAQDVFVETHHALEAEEAALESGD